MKEEDRNKKKALSDFERYVRGEMTKKEENAFQRKLQRDPLTDEATEGFSEISPDESAEDIDHLRKRLKNRIRGNRRVFYYSAAASIAVLMIISSVFLIVQRSKPSQQLSKGIITPVRSEVIDSTPNSEPFVAESINETTEPELPEDAGTQTKSGKKIAAGSTETTISTETVKPGFSDTTAVLAMAEKKDSDSLLVTDQVDAPAAASRMAEAPGENVPRNAMLKAADKSGSELSKAAAAGYSTARSA